MKGKKACAAACGRLFKDRAYRIIFASALSLLASAAFTGYNAFLGAAYRSVWNVSVAVYYALLTALRADVLFREKKYAKGGLSDEEKEARRKKTLPWQCIALLFLDIALIMPIALMVRQQKQVNYSEIAAISVAAYTVYRIAVSARNYFGAKKLRHRGAKILTYVNLVDATVSVLTLQYTLLMTFGDGIKGNMFVLCALSSFSVWAFIVAFSVKAVFSAVRANGG